MKTKLTLPEAMKPLDCCNRWGEMLDDEGNKATVYYVLQQCEKAVSQELEKYDAGFEYFSSFSGSVHDHYDNDQTWESVWNEKGFRRLAVFAVEGDNEGYYVHVHGLVFKSAVDSHQESHILFLVKHCGSQEEACLIANLITQLLHA